MTRNDKRDATLGFSPGPLMSEREVAEYLKVSVRTIVNWKQRGIIPYFKIGPQSDFPANRLTGL